jgi:single-stranded DNA-binding protein
MRTTINTNNNINMIGRVTKVTEFGKDVASITLALDNGRDKEGNEIKDTFVDVKSFDPSVYKNLKVGMLVYVAARFKNSSHVKDGEKVYNLDVIANCIQFLESKAVVEARENAKAAQPAEQPEA